jgi:hypothetical protein
MRFKLASQPDFGDCSPRTENQRGSMSTCPFHDSPSKLDETKCHDSGRNQRMERMIEDLPGRDPVWWDPTISGICDAALSGWLEGRVDKSATCANPLDS